MARGPGSEREVLEICRCPLGRETHKGKEVGSWQICGRQKILHKTHVGPKPAGETFPEPSCPAQQLFPCRACLPTAQGRWEGSGSCAPSERQPWEGGSRRPSPHPRSGSLDPRLSTQRARTPRFPALIDTVFSV